MIHIGIRQQKIKNILINSNNIHLIEKKGSNLKCKCGICKSVFDIVGYMNRQKFICPECKKTKDSERKKEKRNQTSKSEFTTIKKRCKYASYCFSSKNYICETCDIISNPYYSKSEFVDILNKNNKSITITGDFIDINTPIAYKCNVCESVFCGKPHDLLDGKCICKKCQQFHVERIISLYLYEHNIYYEIEKTFNCQKEIISFNFYIPEFDLVIDYDDEQPSLPITLKEKQSDKDEFCKINKLHILHIKYTEKDIYKTLESFINNII